MLAEGWDNARFPSVRFCDFDLPLLGHPTFFPLHASFKSPPCSPPQCNAPLTERCAGPLFLRPSNGLLRRQPLKLPPPSLCLGSLQVVNKMFSGGEQVKVRQQLLPPEHLCFQVSFALFFFPCMASPSLSLLLPFAVFIFFLIPMKPPPQIKSFPRSFPPSVLERPFPLPTKTDDVWRFIYSNFFADCSCVSGDLLSLPVHPAVLYRARFLSFHCGGTRPGSRGINFFPP